MKDNETSHVDFFHELGLLLKADLPLPDSLRQLAESADCSMNELLLDLSAATAKGMTFPDAMARYPKRFSAFQVSLVRLGTETGCLHEILFELARLGRFRALMATRLREITAYPSFVLMIALTFVLLVFGIVVADFGLIFEEMLPGEPLPGLTRLVLNISTTIRDFWGVFAALYLLFAVLLIFSRIPPFSRIVLNWLVALIPGGNRVFKPLEMARLCGLLGLMFRRRLPLSECLRWAVEFTEGVPLKQALRRVADKQASGSDWKECLAQEPAVHNLMKLTVRHVPEAELGAELGALGVIYEERAAVGARVVLTTWNVLLMIVMIVVVVMTVLALFLPMIKVIDCLGG